ncbi:putative Meiosis-specific with OB domain-containing protein [Hypsibius exemplaris]|uniref:Meiosis-specific with OB domain-containing protein n=1 Tax=Hypsibius exemplaris TaxID=2072580 RepID=A0A1W0X2Y0_HYPEX|nr:putative Meiosis-specific with OB domain-containing protein [Hypsibius exemplaris]
MSAFLAPDQNDFLIESKFKASDPPEIYQFRGLPADAKDQRHLLMVSNFINGSSNFPSLISFDGAILRKDDIKEWTSKKNPGMSGALQRFIIRTSVENWTAVTCWGPVGQLKEMTEDLHVGDSVSIRNVRPKSLPEPVNSEENADGVRKFDVRSYLPPLPSDTIYDLDMNNNGQINTLFRQDSRPEILAITRAPPLIGSGNVFPLGLLEMMLASLVGKGVNLIGIVKEKGRATVLDTKYGSRVHKMTVRLFDQDCSGLNITLWGEEHTFMAGRFISFQTTVLLSEVRISKDSRTGLPSLASTGKTLITAYPHLPAAVTLTSFLTALDLSKYRPVVPAIATLNRVSCRAVREAMQSQSACSGLLFAGRAACYLTAFNLDGPLERLITFRCETCHVKVPFPFPQTRNCCSNNFCPQLYQAVQPSFDILCNFTDGSGTLSNVRLTGALAESAVGMTVEEFLNLSMAARESLKWDKLFEVVDIAVTVTVSEVDLFKKTLELIDLIFL